MGLEDEARQRARYMKAYAREVQRRRNAKKKKLRGDDDVERTGRVRRRVEDWLDDDETLETFEKIGRTRQSTPPTVSGAPVAGELFGGTVVARHRDACEVTLERRVIAGDARALRVPTRPHDPEVVVGDEVDLAIDVVDGGFRLAAVRPRRTVLERPDPADPRARLLVAANVDAVVAVQSVERARPGLVDRLLLAAARGGAGLVVCVNKIDLAETEHDEVRRRLHEVAAEHGVPCVEVSATTGDGIDALRSVLAGRSCVFVGPSGVGKSSLCNALDPSLDLRIGDVRETDRKGRHITTSASLHRMAGEIVLIDTPGVRAFGVGDVTPDELAAAFPDIARESRGCRYRDCVHDNEPECAVRAAVADGRLDGARVAAWHRVRSG